MILVGNLGADPEVRYLESGAKVANIRIATSESYKNKNGERVEQTEWHRVELWDRLAELTEQYLSTGRTVYIEGKIRTDTYQDKEGITRYSTKIRATNLTFVGGRNEGNDAESGGQPNRSSDAQPLSNAPAANPTPTSPSPTPAANTSTEADDLPF